MFVESERPAKPSFLAAMRDHIILDAVVDVAGKHATVEQILLGAIGPKAHNAPGPTGLHAGNFHKFTGVA